MTALWRFPAVVALMVATGCTSDETAGPEPDESKTPSVDVARESETPRARKAVCPELVADASDLEQRRPRSAASDGDFRTSVVSYRNDDRSRELTLSSAPTDTVFGHGIPGPRTDVEVQGRPAERAQPYEDTVVYQWRHKSGDCPFWTVTFIGFAEGELAPVLESVRAVADDATN